MNWKDIRKLLFEYGLLGGKALLTLTIALFQLPYLIFAYFITDLIHTFYEKYQRDEAQDLSVESINEVKSTTQKTQEDLDKIAKEQKEYYEELKTKQSSLVLLNKLITESLIREKDLLSLTGTSGYYQIFVYSASVQRLAKSLGVVSLNRKYPVFLEELGFARLGQNSPCFIINKNNLKEDKLRNIKEFKKFITYHFSKIRKKEWDAFLEQIKSVNEEKYKKLKEKGYKDVGALKINFLLIETNMNITNIGFVDGDRMGLGKVTNNEKINQQILEGSNLSNTRITSELKIKIKKIIGKQDISLLLDGIIKKDREKIDTNQDIIKTNLKTNTIIDFYKVHSSDLATQLRGIGFTKKKADIIAAQIINQAVQYKQALDELRINI